MKRLPLILIILAFLAGSVEAHVTAHRVSGYVFGSDGSALPGVNVIEKGTTNGTITDIEGHYELYVSSPDAVLEISFVGFTTQQVKVNNKAEVSITMMEDVTQLSEVVVTGMAKEPIHKRIKNNISQALQGRAAGVQITQDSGHPGSASRMRVRGHSSFQLPVEDNEEYSEIEEIGFKGALRDPLSTFSIDVDAAAYSNVRRFLENGQRPPVDAVRIEEMINYFEYDYVNPADDVPFSITTEVAAAPWNAQHRLVHIGLQGKRIEKDNLPPSNLVFLIDVSGSMSDYNKLPLLKTAFRLLVNELRPQDRVSIVVYAGAAGTVLEPTTGDNKQDILDALDRLSAGGSTAGAAGIELAYRLAEKHFIEEGNNRVILATDGDFNVGVNSNKGLEKLIEEKRDKNIFLTALGFGMGNYKDAKLELLADKGNGNYAYIDELSEAKKVFVNEFGGTMFTIAKDVKIQVEFNPAKVSAYRLIGYENRMLAAEDFNNDRKDAGEIGSGHSVTALYEVIPVGVKSEFYNVDELKYQQGEKLTSSGELLTVKVRYKEPTGVRSRKLEIPLMPSDTRFESTSENFRWSASVAAFGMILRDSPYRNDVSVGEVRKWAQGARGEDIHGYRGEFMKLLDLGELMSSHK